VTALFASLAAATPGIALAAPSDEEIARAREAENAAKMSVAQIEVELASVKSEAEVALQKAMSAAEELNGARYSLEQATQTARQAQADADKAKADYEAGKQEIASIAQTAYRDGGSSLDSIAPYLSADGLRTVETKQATLNSFSASANVKMQKVAALQQVANVMNDAAIQAQAKQAEWDAQKGQVEASLSQAEADYQARSAELAAIDAANRASGASYVSASGFRNPLDIPIVVTSPFGMRYHPVLGVMKGHSGTDMAADCGTIIRAVASGYVNAVSSDVSAGNYVDINHGLVGGNSVITEYLHMQAQYVSPGQYVNAGDALGEVGSTGYATGCHLHFGVLQNGSYVEPMDYL